MGHLRREYSTVLGTVANWHTEVQSPVLPGRRAQVPCMYCSGQPAPDLAGPQCVRNSRQMRVAIAGAVLGLGLAVSNVPAGPQAELRSDVAVRLPHRISATTAGAGRPVVAETDEPALTDIVQRYCTRCHNDRLLRGNLTLENFDVAAANERAPTAEKMIRKLRAGMMPPPGQRRPAGDTLLALVETLEEVVDAAAARDPDPGRRRFQRLNRPEYERVIRDLLALEIDAGRWLPADTYLGAFDNMADAQGLSTTLLEAYLRAATEVSRLAVGNPAALSRSVKYTNPIEVSQHAWDHIEGTPYGTRGGMVVTHDFPADGEYVFTVGTLFGRGTRDQDVDLSIDGEGVALLGLEHNGRSTVPIRTAPIFVRSGQRQVAAAFVRTIEGPYDDRLQTPGWSFVGGEDSQAWANYGITALPHLSELTITGPSEAVGVSETPSRRALFHCHPGGAAVAGPAARECAREIVTRIAVQAYRRPVTDDDLAGPMAFYDEAVEQAGFEVGVRMALQAILSSPSFIFRLERVPTSAEPGESYRLSDIDLASRLSFFLWATVPDAELLEAARAGRLSEPAALEAQVRRMLADPRAEALASRFASQWLRLQDTEDNQPEPYLLSGLHRPAARRHGPRDAAVLRSPGTGRPQPPQSVHGGLLVPERQAGPALRHPGHLGGRLPPRAIPGRRPPRRAGPRERAAAHVHVGAHVAGAARQVGDGGPHGHPAAPSTA